MIYTVAISERAAREIEDTSAWWARERSLGQAQRWYDGIRGAIASLAEMPQRRPIVVEQPFLSYEVRQLDYGPGSKPTHRIPFTLVRQSVVVLTVRHVARGPLTEDDLV